MFFQTTSPHAFAFVGLVGLLESGVATFWTRCLEIGELAFDAVAGKILGLGDNVLGEAADPLHEFGAWHRAMFHLLELEFPFARHLR